MTTNFYRPDRYGTLSAEDLDRYFQEQRLAEATAPRACPVCDGTTAHAPGCVGQLDPTLPASGETIFETVSRIALASAGKGVL